VKVQDTLIPNHDPLTQYVQELTPVFVEGVWKRRYQVNLLAQEIAADRANTAKLDLMKRIEEAADDRLKNFAKTRGYGSLDSIGRYKNLSDDEIEAMQPDEKPLAAKFRAECKYLSVMTTRTYAKLYLILDQVEKGQRPVPTSYQDIEADLPELVWPV
jgi:hypothetical protein